MMAKGSRYAVKFRRRREGKTNYKKRLGLLKSGSIRFVVRRSNKYIICQFIKYTTKGDKTLLTVNSNQLTKLGWKHKGKNLPAAYLTGLLAGKLASDAGITKAVLDIGLQTSTKGSKLYAALKGVIDSGIEVPYGEGNLPDEKRITGAHINENIPKDFEKVKTNVLKAKVVRKK